MELLTVIKCPAARGHSGARPNPSIIGARSLRVSCTPLHPLCTVCTTIAPRVLHFSAVHNYTVIMEDTFSDCITLHSKDHNRRQ